MKELFYTMGRCAGCKVKVVRKHDFRGDPGRTLTRVCRCAPHLEAAHLTVNGRDGRLVVWDERSCKLGVAQTGRAPAWGAGGFVGSNPIAQTRGEE